NIFHKEATLLVAHPLQNIVNYIEARKRAPDEVVDDAACLIGSANINDRSLMPHRDTEMAALIISKKVAKDLQSRLKKQHKPFLKKFPRLDNGMVDVGYYPHGEFDLRGSHEQLTALLPGFS
ncbi:Hypothetical protein, putative, partial [Bodo saltans]